MAQAATKVVDEMGPPEIAAVDRAHLARMTFGDHTLERELLELFDRQAVILLTRMQPADPATSATLAHTLKGSALGIGANAVAAAAASVEQAAGSSELTPAIARLASAIAAARGAIATLLRADEA